MIKADILTILPLVETIFAIPSCLYNPKYIATDIIIEYRQFLNIWYSM